ncbi:MAG TPA: UDP-N-acetylmuramate:L-alanyl-gamma-D-glutamyl-meso-diaminopimelate ligase [Gammaproteobacteria bacterium]
MHVHILGICGTFMGGVAAIAKSAGHAVSGSDANVYPPMSTQLERLDIPLTEGWDPAQFEPRPDIVVIGNALSRGNPAVEYVLDNDLPYVSGPQWLAENALAGKWRLAVAGTHGKTTTSGMLAWILEHAGLNPGFLIGGVPGNFEVSARLTDSPFFVLEADEYDTAFFDKRSKFVHYRPRTAILNNLEFDHADIFENLDAIKKQFHHLVRTVPGNGLIVANGMDGNLDATLEKGCWTPRETFGHDGRSTWNAHALSRSANEFEISFNREVIGRLKWPLHGMHNMQNALAAIAAARNAGVPAAVGIEALEKFRGVKRRMELRGEIGGVQVFDDFAHHPTAIRLTLEGARNAATERRLVAVFEPRSNSMRMGLHRSELAQSFAAADQVFIYQPPYLDWSVRDVVTELGERGASADNMESLVEDIRRFSKPGDSVVIMSNGGFGGLHEKLLAALERQQEADA